MFNPLPKSRGKRITVLIVIIGILLGGACIFFFATHKNAEVIENAPVIQAIEIKKVSEMNSMSTFSTVGTIEAISEAALQTQAGGQVTSVSVGLGDHVAAGQVIATIENRSQSAAVEQAQGALEAAEVGAASSHVSLTSAQNGVSTAQTTGINTYKSAYISIDSVLHNDVDTLFSSLNGSYNGLRIEGAGQAPALNAKRNELEEQLLTWSAHTSTVSEQDIVTSLDGVYDFISDVSMFVDSLYTLATNEEISSSYSNADKAANQALLSSDRVKLNQTLQQINAARTAIVEAKKGLEQAQLAGSADVSSAASAQLKIAQGSLSAAQANYEKTIVRSPLSGVVNSLYIKTGDYVSPAQPAAVIANNNGLQVTTAVGQDDVRKISIGDTVHIEDTATGTVTEIAPALDPKTGKIEVKVSVEEGSGLVNGATASVTFTEKSSNESAQNIFHIPLTALKITSDGPVVFTVASDLKLNAVPVTIGSTVGDSVAVESGLTPDIDIVTDARGLKAGQTVTINK